MTEHQPVFSRIINLYICTLLAIRAFVVIYLRQGKQEFKTFVRLEVLMKRT